MKYIVVNLLLSVCVINSSINSKVPAILSNYSNLNSHNTRVNKDEDKDKDNSNSVLRIMFAQGFNKSPSDLVDLGLVNSKVNFHVLCYLCLAYDYYYFFIVIMIIIIILIFF